MTQKNNLIKIIENSIDTIKQRLKSYKKVDATLSEETLSKIAGYLLTADEELEKGFVKDACNEIDNVLKVN